MKLLVFCLFNLITAIVFSQLNASFQLGTCNKDAHPEFMNSYRLITKKVSGDTLTLRIGMVANCFYKPEITAVLKSDSLFIDLGNKEQDVYAACLCCFEILVNIYPFSDTSIKLFALNDTPIPIDPKPTYFLPKPEEFHLQKKTNISLATGERMGQWVSYFPKSSKIKEITYYGFVNGKSKVGKA